jgi:hypothetical protein
VYSEALVELLLFLFRQGKGAKLERLLERRLEEVRKRREERQRGERAVRDGEGRAPAGVVLERAWLEWNGGTVRRLAEGIAKMGFFWDLPLLAEALRRAGCRDERILGHLDRAGEHSRRCWVLHLLLTDDPE